MTRDANQASLFERVVGAVYLPGETFFAGGRPARSRMPEFPEEVLTVSKKGRVEVRALVRRGKFALIEYLDPETMERTEDKYKLVLIGDDGAVEEYFILPLKQANRRLMVIPREKKGDKLMVWNREAQRAEPMFP